MEIWQYIEVLRQKNKSWFILKDNTEEKINALTKIAIYGSPSLIYCLIDFLKDRNTEIRERTCDTIIHLFKKIGSKKGYHDALKQCQISQSDIDFYEATFSTDQFVELLAISSLNGNGYVREKAVIKLSTILRSRAIQFLVYRLADWVLPVRQAALKGIENYKSIVYIDCLIENLPIITWLQKVERTDLSSIYNDIIGFIATTNRKYTITNLKNYPDKARLLIARHISDLLVDSSWELKVLLTDKHFLIRSLVIDHFDKIGQAEINTLLNDKSAKIRLRILYSLKNRNDFENIIKNYLADNSATIRHLARFTLRESEINFGEFYNENLQANKQIIGSLAGLAEVDAKQFSETIKMYLDAKQIKIIKVAFSALRKIDREAAYLYAITNLDSPFVGLRNTIIDFLSSLPRWEVLEKARDCYENGDCELKKSMLKLFSKIGGWTAISDIMIGTIDSNEEIRQLSFCYLNRWKAKMTRLFSAAQQNEIERARQIFNFVYEAHEDRQYFKINPMDGLDFYFK